MQLSLCWALLLGILPSIAAGQADVIKASGGQNLSIDSVATQGFFPISGPTIRETASGQLAGGGTIILTLPSGFVWNDNLTGADITITIEPTGAANTKLQVSFAGITTSEATFTIDSPSETKGNGQGPGRVEIQGLELRSTTTNVPTTGQISNTGSTGPSTNYGNLSTAVGAMTKVRVETKANGTGQVVPSQNITAGNSLTVYAIARDVGDNFIQNIALDDESDWILTGGNGEIPPSSITPSSDLKSAVFSSTTTGTSTIQANYTGVSSIATQLITVDPRPAESMTIQTQPSDTVAAGQIFPQQPVIFLWDQFGNKVTSDNITEATVSLNSGNADVGTQTMQASGGEISFSNLSTTIADTISLKFESTGLSMVTSEEIVVLPAVASDLSFIQQPSNTANNNTINPAVAVQLLDQFGNKVTSTDTTVNITNDTFIDGGNSTLTTQTNSSGIATFNGIMVSGTAGSNVQLEAYFSNINQPVLSDEFLIIASDDLARYEITNSSNNDIGEQQAGTSFDIRIRALNGDGNDFTFSSDSTLTITADNTIQGGSFEITIPNGSSSVDTSITLTSTGNTKVYADASEGISGESNSFNVTPSDVISTSNATVSADPTAITANGTSTSQITVQLKDEFGNNLVSGGETVELTTSAGTFNGGVTTIPATDEGDGTYTTVLTSSSTAGETATISATLNSSSIGNQATVDFEAGEVTTFGITLPNPSKQTAGNTFNIDIEAIDAQGNIVPSFNGSATLSSTATLSSGTNTTINFSGGAANHPLTVEEADSAITITITADNLYNVSKTSTSFIVLPASPDASTSTVTTVPDVIQNDSGSESAISVILRDQFGNRVYQSTQVSLTLEQLEEDNATTGGVAPDASLANGSNIPYDASKGVYHDTLTSASTVEVVEISAEFGSGPTTIINQTATVDIVIPNTWTAGAGGPSGNRTDWTNPDNWSQGEVPDVNDFVIIPNIGDLPILDLNISMGSFEIQSGVSLTLFGGNSITVSGNTNVEGNLDIEDNTELSIGGNFMGSGTFTAGATTIIDIGGDISLSSFLARTSGSQISLNGSSPQAISTTNFLAQKLYIQNDVTVTSGDLIDTSELNITEDNTLEIAQNADVTVDNLKNLSGDGQLILNNNTLVVSGDLSLLNIDTSDGTVVFGIRQGENFADYPDLERQQIANLSQMENAVINNINDVRTTEDIIVDGNLILENGNLIISSGKSLIAPSQTYNNGAITFRRTINQKGWVMMGAPVNTSFADLFSELTIQGMANSDYPNKQPNILYYKENAECTNAQDDTIPCTDNQRWRTLSDANNSIHNTNTDSLGIGYFFYVFGDVSGDTDYNDSLPVTLRVSGQEYQYQSSSFDFSSVSYSANSDTVESLVGWNLLSNPWGATLDWDNAGWTKTNVDNVVYVWDRTTNSYKTWNGIDGSLTNGLIKPFQAFWVKTNDTNPQLSVNKSAKTTGGQFYGKSNSKKEPASIGFQLDAGTLQTTTHITLSPDGSNAKDKRDGYRLLPFDTDTYLEFYTSLEDGSQLVINNLARSFGKEITIPLHVGGFENGEALNGEYTISWPKFGDVPKAWTLVLEDKKTGEKIDLRKNTFYTFNLSQSQQKAVINNMQNFQLVGHPSNYLAKSSGSSESRFLLRIQPGADAADIPDEYSLGINYPNPFTTSTKIKYNTPVEGNVEISIYDILGRRVKTILDERQPADFHEIEWAPMQLSSGIYICVMRADGKQFTKKLTYIK